MEGGGTRPGLLEFPGVTSHVETPAEADVGSTVVVTIVTLGNSCLREGETRLLLVEHEAEVLTLDGGVWDISVFGVRKPGQKPIAVSRRIYVRD